MGGDDLGSDDEFLSGGGVMMDDEHDFDYSRKSVLQASTVAVLSDDGQEGSNKQGNKRKHSTEGNDNDNKDDPGEPQIQSKSKKTKRSQGSSRRKMLLEAGRSMEQESAQHQASFVWTNLLHQHQLKSGKHGDDDDAETELQSLKVQPFHFKTSNSPTLEGRLRDCIPSMKQLKSWNHTHSPMIIMVCLSARRAVQVLKEIQSFKTRAAKLFAKHLQVTQQEEWLRQTPFGIAVGTPHRLLVLCQRQALTLQHTKLVVLDAHKDHKQFTVCTLPDTAPHCMEFLKDHVVPQLHERPKELKLSFC
jgi:hypothetical protein